MGLIARALEARGIATICMSSAYSITRAVNPPRSVFLDYPLGHTAGKPNDPANQRRIMIDTLNTLEIAQTPGGIRRLKYQWSADHSWKDRVMRPGQGGSGGSAANDDRVARFDTPQYQFAEDEQIADSACPTCVLPPMRSAQESG